MSQGHKDAFLSKYGTTEHIQNVMDDNKRRTGHYASSMSSVDDLMSNPCATKDQLHKLLDSHAERMDVSNRFHDEEFNAHYIDNHNTTDDDVKEVLSKAGSRQHASLYARRVQSEQGQLKLARNMMHGDRHYLSAETKHPSVIRAIHSMGVNEDSDYEIAKNAHTPKDVHEANMKRYSPDSAIHRLSKRAIIQMGEK